MATIFASPTGVAGAAGTGSAPKTIAAALAAASSGDTVILMPGTYDLTGAATMAVGAHVWLRGSGIGATILKKTTAGSAMLTTDGGARLSDFSVKDCSWFQDAAAAPTNTSRVIYERIHTRCWVDTLYLEQRSRVRSCVLEGSYDILLATSDVECEDTVVKCYPIIGYESYVSPLSDFIGVRVSGENGVLRARNCRFEASSRVEETGEFLADRIVRGITVGEAVGTGKAVLRGVTVTSEAHPSLEAGLLSSIYNETGATCIVDSDCEYDTDLDYGTITPITEYYIDQVGGADTNNGLSSSAAFKTIAKLSTLNGAAGPTGGCTINLKRRCTWEEPLTMMWTTGDLGVLVQPYGTGSRPKLTTSPLQSSIEMFAPTKHIIIDGIETYLGAYGAMMASDYEATSPLDGLRLSNCVIHGCGANGVCANFYSRDLEVDQCIIMDCGDVGVYAGVATGTTPEHKPCDAVVSRNTITNCTNGAISVTDSDNPFTSLNNAEFGGAEVAGSGLERSASSVRATAMP